MFEKENILFHQNCKDKNEMFELLASKVVENGYGNDKRLIKKALNEREAESTTGMMDGFAIPHAKTTAITSATIIFVKNDIPIEWESLDGQPINYVLGLFIPENESGTTHLQILSKVSRMLMNEEKKMAIKNAKNQIDILEIIKESIG